MAFLPARMTRLLLGGHQQHLEATIALLHQEGVVHLEDYQDPTGTTTIGTPLESGDRASELLVRLRGLLKSIGAEGVRGKDLITADPGRMLEEAESAAAPVLQRLQSVRGQILALEQESAMLAPLEGLNVPLDAVASLRSVRAFIGTARTDPTPRLAAHGEVEAVPSGGGVAVAVIVPASRAADTERVLADCGFQAAALPAGRSGTPAERRKALAAELATRRAELQQAEAGLAELRTSWSTRLGGLERSLAAEVERTQAPLRFGVTKTTFHLEGWVPVDRLERVRKAIQSRFGESVYLHELGDKADQGHAKAAIHGSAGGHAQHQHAHGHTAVAAAPTTGTGPGLPGAHDVHADGHGGDGEHHADPSSEPPILLRNKGAARPYEFLLGLLGKPRYWEIDPTKLMLIFFPLFFGLMVGDLGTGLLIILVGLFLKKNKVFGIGGPAVGRTLVMGGAMAALIGLVVFGEAFGIHFVLDEHALEEGEHSWESLLGLHIPDHGFLHKTGGHGAHVDAGGEVPHGDAIEGMAGGEAGTTPPPAITPHAESTDAKKGLLEPSSAVHLSVNGWFNLGYYSKTHDTLALLVWAVIIGTLHIIVGLLVGVRNVYVHHGAALAIQEKAAWLTLMGGGAIAAAGWMSHSNLWLAVGGGIAIASVVLLCMGAAHVLGASAFWMGILEVPALFGNIMSYSRLAAIGASKAGMAIAFATIGFDVIGGPVGVLVYIVAVLLILVLSIIAGTLQSLRLQFVEFFGKFYSGGGRPYVPFGRRAE